MPATLPVPAEIEADAFAWRKDLPSEDGEPMDTPWHRFQMNLLIDSIDTHWDERKDFYSGGNMFLYFSETYARNKDFRGPDFFVVKDVERDKVREYWAIWDENDRFPNAIVELLSESTKKIDLGEKKDVYERTFRTPEYYCYDPAERLLLGWRLNGPTYVPIEPDKAGRLWSEQLDLNIGPWTGKYNNLQTQWIRLFMKNGRLVMTRAESEAANAVRATAQKEQQKARADQEASRAEHEAARADREAAARQHEADRADREAAARQNEAARADREAAARMAAEAELAQLKLEIAKNRQRDGKKE